MVTVTGGAGAELLFSPVGSYNSSCPSSSPSDSCSTSSRSSISWGAEVGRGGRINTGAHQCADPFSPSYTTLRRSSCCILIRLLRQMFLQTDYIHLSVHIWQLHIHKTYKQQTWVDKEATSTAILKLHLKTYLFTRYYYYSVPFWRYYVYEHPPNPCT